MNVPETFFSVPEELRLFLLSCLWGLAIGASYDVFRAVRLLFRHNAALTAAEDVLFAVLYGVFLWSFASGAARGELRVYYVIGNMIGAALYHFTVGRVTILTVRKLIGVLSGSISFILRPLRSVFVLLCEKAGEKFVKSSKVAVKFVKKIGMLLLRPMSLMYNKLGINTQRRMTGSGKKIQEKTEENRSVQPRAHEARRHSGNSRLRRPHHRNGARLRRKGTRAGHGTE
jgi:spore cortex biosynthesis protein YabQ